MILKVTVSLTVTLNAALELVNMKEIDDARTP